MSEQAHVVTSARMRSDALSGELEATNARVDAANELAEDLSRQRESHVNEIGSLKAQLVSRLAEIESLEARLSKVALPQFSGLATVDESLAVDDDEEDDEGDNDEEPGTPELSDEDEGDGRKAPRAKSARPPRSVKLPSGTRSWLQL